MATLGNSTLPNGGSYFWDDFGNTQFWTGYTMPAGGGTMSDLYVYVGGDGSSTSGQLVIWGATHIFYHGSVTIPSSPRSYQGQSWVHLGGLNVYIPAGTVNIGFWASGGVVWTQESSNTTYHEGGVSAPANLSNQGSLSNGLGAYLLYSPGPTHLFIRRSGAWHQVSQLKIRRSGSWISVGNLSIRRSSAWTQL